jgi:hypothetical protein
MELALWTTSFMPRLCNRVSVRIEFLPGVSHSPVRRWVGAALLQGKNER